MGSLQVRSISPLVHTLYRSRRSLTQLIVKRVESKALMLLTLCIFYCAEPNSLSRNRSRVHSGSKLIALPITIVTRLTVVFCVMTSRYRFRDSALVAFASSPNSGSVCLCCVCIFVLCILSFRFSFDCKSRWLYV